MILTATARGVRVSRCFSHAKLPTKRLASLTGAIQRGARKARDVGERTERYTSSFDARPDAAFKRDDTNERIGRYKSRSTSTLNTISNRDETQRTGRYKSGSNSDFNRRFRRDDSSQRTERYNPRSKSNVDQIFRIDNARERPEQSKSRFVSDSPAALGKKDMRVETERYVSRLNSSGDTPFQRDDTRAPHRAVPFKLQDVRSREAEPRHFQQKMDNRRDQEGESRYSANVRQAQPGQFRPRTGSRSDQGRGDTFAKEDARGVDPDRSSIENFLQREGDRSSFSKKPLGEESFSRADQRDQNGRRHPKKAINEEGWRRLRPGILAASEEDRRSDPPKFDRRQRPLREGTEDRADHAHLESMPAKRHVSVPLSVPRSSAASEFIYGTSAVKAALQAGTRKLYKLYIYQGASGTKQREGDKEFFKLAQKRDLNVKRLGGDELPLLDKMAQGRPHNGYVLEASQLPNTPAEALDSVDGPGDGFSFIPGHQSEEEISVNGTSRKVSGSRSCYPFVLMLDSILDPGNLGAIIRSAAFFGVDAIAVIDHSLAPFSPVTLKASSGAAEYMRYLRIKKDYDFVKRSKSNGWKFFAAVAPESVSAGRGGLNKLRLREAEEALLEGPCVLMLGGEGDGLRPRLQKAADGMIGIAGAGGLNSEFGLDSLNVSVAAALMMQTFVKGANAAADTAVSRKETESPRDDEQLF